MTFLVRGKPIYYFTTTLWYSKYNAAGQNVLPGGCVFSVFFLSLTGFGIQ